MFLLSTLEICPQEGKGNISEKESDEIYELFQKFQNACYQVILNNIKKVCDAAEFEFDRRPITLAFPDGDRKRMYMTWKIEFKKLRILLWIGSNALMTNLLAHFTKTLKINLLNI